jgi:hypothetical protein
MVRGINIPVTERMSSFNNRYPHHPSEHRVSSSDIDPILVLALVVIVITLFLLLMRCKKWYIFFIGGMLLLLLLLLMERYGCEGGRGKDETIRVEHFTCQDQVPKKDGVKMNYGYKPRYK